MAALAQGQRTARRRRHRSGGTAAAAAAGRIDDAGRRPIEVLGLQPGAIEAEIHAAHRRLMRTAHPDSGGSDWLATRINQARDVLLG